MNGNHKATLEHLTKTATQSHWRGDDYETQLLSELDALTSIIEEAERARAYTVQQLREEYKTSWTVIGRNVGTSKQAAQKRYGTTPSTAVAAVAGDHPLPI